MPINSSIAIFETVGRGAKNVPLEVRAVQGRLNELMSAPRVALTVDGDAGRRTIKMIRDFQRSVCKFNNPDGRVDPVGKTITALNDPRSEGIWANMSLPPPKAQAQQSIDKSLDEDDDDAPFPTTRKQAVSVAIGIIGSTHHLTADHKRILKIVLERTWHAQKGGYTAFGPGGMTKLQFDQWIKTSMLAFNVTRTMVTLAAPSFSAAAVGVAGIFAMLAPFVMFAGFLIALKHAQTTADRIYRAISISYATVYWASGGASQRPDSSPTFLSNYTSVKGPLTADEHARFTQAWEEGREHAMTGIYRTGKKISAQTGLSFPESLLGLRMILDSMGEQELAREILKELASNAGREVDLNVANALRRTSERLDYPH